ncbi:nicotinate-nicotinamide nucleotide adenylyltransferase [Caloramator mitchellensis]|nr:cytidyltransferase [Caloramator mitchellensis]
MENINILNILSNEMNAFEMLPIFNQKIKTIKSLINNKIFITKLNILLQEKKFTARDLFASINEYLIKLGPVPDDFLFYLYEYTLNKSFPNANTIGLKEEYNITCEFFLKMYSIMNEIQKYSEDDTWQSKHALHFLNEDEVEDELKHEYKNFVKSFRNQYIYELMKLHREITHHNTIDHICGVHDVAMHIARQIKKIGLPISLAKISGASIGHDIGKFGCRTSELKRLPYLHYYYTDIWFKKNKMPYIGHIAVNHSTWDLELENLPIESLVLIYADFRVKNKKIDDKNVMYIFELKDSFDVILEKLDNVDEKKEKRYRKVYSKLKDFEDYLISLGINVSLESNDKNIKLEPSYSLLQGKEIINNIKYNSIYHNINLMYRLRDESSLNLMLESARSLNDKNNLREYLSVFEEYSQYLTQHQKILMLKFLYDEMINPEDDIRKQCAQLIGTLIATFDEDYRKEVPEDVTIEKPDITGSDLFKQYLDLFLNPDERLIEIHRNWIGYNLNSMLKSLFKSCRTNQLNSIKQIICEYYKSNDYKKSTLIYLIQAIKTIPIDENSSELIKFLINMLKSGDKTIELTSLDAIYNISTRYEYFPLKHELIDELNESLKHCKYEAEEYIKFKTLKQLGENIDFNINKYEPKISEISLSNLKTATNWILKKLQVELLFDFSLENIRTHGLYTAIHYCNILKVSAYESVRNKAGEMLVRLIPHLSMEQRNDIVVELLRALEIEGYQFTKYIPEYLGQIILFLKPVELDEVVDDFVDKIKNAGVQINSLLLKTVAITVANYHTYKSNFFEEDSKYKQRLSKILGVMLNGLVHYEPAIKRVAINVIGKNIFENAKMSIEEKYKIFKLLSKKILTLIPEDKEDELLFFSNASSLNHIYRFISDYSIINGEINIENEKKVAFFPGSFDPFSLSHKEIAKAIRDLGFTVYLQVDEFSWSKQTLPNLLRRKIINLSIADELNMFLFPENVPINIANINDLLKLNEIFPNSEVYLTVGSDVIQNASAYKSSSNDLTIFDFSHIVFERKANLHNLNDVQNISEILGKFKKDIIRLSLSPQYEDISSTQIRDYIDQNKDISALVDPLAEKYIYENGFYRREPQYKSIIKTISLDIDVYEEYDEAFFDMIIDIIGENKILLKQNLIQIAKKYNSRFIVLRDVVKNEIIGVSAFHWLRSSSLYFELLDSEATEYIRENAVGRMIMLDAFIINNMSSYDNILQILITETLSFCIAKDYDYAIYKNQLSLPDDDIQETLKLYGFLNIPHSNSNAMVVNMNSPITLSLDIENVIKEPFRSNKNILRIIKKSRKKLLKALSELYPGHLVLPIDMNIVHESLVRKICNENGVSTIPETPRNLGPFMCVPYGNFLNRYIVPNTVTKSLHTEKFFEPDMKRFEIKAFPYYLDIENQIRMIKSFNRPMILIDDVLHKGYRIKALDPLLKREDIKVHKIIVGILSGRGKEIMDVQNRDVDSVYFIPKLRHWFNENLLYPYIGGDTLWRGEYPKRNLIPSINLILPYASPTFIKGASKKSIFTLSKTCLENALDILKVIEHEYQILRERNLTLSNLGDVFIAPRYPDHGKDVLLDLSLSPSYYLENDIESLNRIEDIINRS